MSTHPNRLIFDISTIADWFDTPIGIVRVERALAARACLHARSPVFAVYDPNMCVYRELASAWRDAIISGKASINPWAFYAARFPRSHRSDRIPQSLRALVNVILPTRRALLFGLERLRIRRTGTVAARLIDRVQRCLMSKKYRLRMMHPDGGRRDLVPYDLALGPAITFGPNDVFVCVGWQWIYDMAWLRPLKEQTSFKFVLLCHDILLLLWPQLYRHRGVNAFRKWFETIIPLTDLVIFTTNAARADTVRYCEANGIALSRSRVVRPGVERLPQSAVTGKLPHGIEAEHYALLVGTLEPRKGHQLLYDVWLRLLAAGIPQSARFKLVLVGEPNGIDDKLLHALRHDPRLENTLRLLPRVGDAELAELYAGCAFCLLPSLYEGYGLPVIEAFDHGKAVIASTGGALPEVVGGLSPCLDPRDAEVWYETLKAWILDPKLRRPYEQAIAATFRHHDWDEAATAFFDAIAAEGWAIA